MADAHIVAPADHGVKGRGFSCRSSRRRTDRAEPACRAVGPSSIADTLAYRKRYILHDTSPALSRISTPYIRNTSKFFQAYLLLIQ